MSGLSKKTLTIFQNFEVSLEFLKSNIHEMRSSLVTVYIIMNNLSFYKNILYRALKKSRYDRVIEMTHRAVNAYCTFFDTPGCEDINPENVLHNIDTAIALMQSIRERRS